MAEFPNLDRLKAQLLQSGMQQKNQPLYQVINQLIDALRQTIQTTTVNTGGGGTPLTNLHYLTHENDQPSLPNSRRLVAGSGISFNKTGQSLIVNAHGIPYELNEGIEGPMGPPGIRGIDGTQGIDGLPGPPGMDGYCDVSENIPPLGTVLAGSPWYDWPYNAGDYTASGSMTWTVDASDLVTSVYWYPNPKTFVWTLMVQLTTVGGTASNFLIAKLPNNVTAKRNQRGPLQIVNGGLGMAGVWIAQPSNQTILFAPSVGGNWSLGTNNGSVFGTIIIEIF